MDYQNIITAYKNDDLDISDLKMRLDVTKSLIGRPSFRAESTVFDYSVLFNNMKNILVIKEVTSNYELFNNEVDAILLKNFEMILKNIKECKAWNFMKLNSKNFTLDRFNKKNVAEKISMLKVMSDNYYDFLSYQGVADIRDCLKNGNNLDNDKIKKLYFISQMFYSFKNDKVKEEFFCFNKQFIKTLIGFKKAKAPRLDLYFQGKTKKMNQLYEDYLKYFSIDDYFDLIENINLTSKTAKVPGQTIIEIFSEISEIAEEKRYVKSNSELLDEIKDKYEKMSKLEGDYNLQKEQREEQDRLELSRKKVEEQIKKQNLIKAKFDKLQKDTIANKQVKVEAESISKINNEEVAKECVIPLIFTWIGRENIPLSQRVGKDTLELFFNKLKSMERKSNSRVKIFLLTNVDRDETIKRVYDLNRNAKENGMNKVFEGAFGGYSSFKVDNNGNITNMSKMSPENKIKIIKLLESSTTVKLERDLIDKTENDYIRYVLTNQNKKAITTSYLAYMSEKILEDEKIARQPLNFMPFKEKDKLGIDVVLKSQLKGISQLKEYYNSKYCIKSDKMLKINIDKIKDFIGVDEIGK